MHPELLLSGLAITGVALATPTAFLQPKELAESHQMLGRTVIPPSTSARSPEELVTVKRRRISRKRAARPDADAIPCKSAGKHPWGTIVVVGLQTFSH